MNSQYRILTYSNNLYIVQTKFLWFWLNEDEQFNNIEKAKQYIANLKLLKEVPKLVDISYID